MIIQKVEFANFHGQTKSVNLNERLTYICGNNGRGKSTILQAIQLALLGYIPGYGKKVSDIFQHATDRQMLVAIYFDTGEWIRRVYTKTSKGVDTDVICNPDGFDIKIVTDKIELPILNFNALLGMTANQLKAWFTNNMFTANKQIGWETVLHDAIPEGISDREGIAVDVFDYINVNRLLSTEDVPRVSEYVKAVLSAKKAELNRLNSTLQTLVYYDDIPADRTLEEVKAEYDTIKDIENNLVRYHKVQLRISELQDTIQNKCRDVYDDPKEFKTKLDQMVDEQKEFYRLIEDITDKHRMLNAKRNDIYRQLQELDGKTGICPVSKKHCEYMEADETLVTSLETKRDEITEEMNKYASQKAQFHDDYALTEMEIRNMQGLWDLYTRSKTELESLEVPDIDVSKYTVESCKAKEDALMEEIKHITANEAYTKIHDSTLAEKFAIEGSIEILKAYDKLTGPNGIASALLKGDFDDMAADISDIISRILKEYVEVKFNISESANSFSFGIQRGNDYISYEMLSSGEKCIFAIALMQSILNRLNPHIKIIMADDIFDHLDKENIDKLIQYMYNEDEQFILAGVNAIGKGYKESVLTL